MNPFSELTGRTPMRIMIITMLVMSVFASAAEETAVDGALTTPNIEETFYERGAAADGVVTFIPPQASNVTRHLPPYILGAVALLILVSAFYSAAETAFFSIHRLRLRSLKEDDTASGALIAQMMEHPGRLLTTILISNLIVNMLIGVLLGARVEDMFLELMPGVPRAVTYLLAVGLCASLILFFGEIAPKVFAVQASEQFARASVFPLLATDRILVPLRDGLLGITNLLFKVTRFHELRAAPFITDDELRSALTDSEAQGVIEEDERQMIQGILEVSDAQLREILVPRPDVIALAEDATVSDALSLYREHRYSRMPVYRDSLDTIFGTLVAKDLLPYMARGELDRDIRPLIRPAHYVPATMTVQQFVHDAQRHHTHIAVVVDEYGGAAGIVTLEDALEQVVGDMMDEADEEPGYKRVGDKVYDIDGDLR
ncbi:MAG: hemolysin family protein, partial [Candidatus Hydrogenedentes bacterium]|nr:hemolysin family protein [Candidatus Hydrogenedentota bacterium]